MNILFGPIMAWIWSVIHAEDERIFVKPGSDVRLQCPFKSAKEPIVWRGPANLTVYSIGQILNELLFNNGSIQIVGNYSVGEYDLVIQNYTDHNGGLYQCETIVKDRPVIHSIFVKTAEKPNITIHNETIFKMVIGFENSPLTIQCLVDRGAPQVNISLIEDNNTLATSISNKLTYMLTASRQIHLQFIKCVAENDFYEVQRTFQVFVKLLPKVHVTAFPSNTATIGENLTLTCVYRTNEMKNIIIKWMINKTVISGEENPHLLLQKVERHSAGVYTCEVTNDAGKGTGSLNILVMYPPVTVVNKTKFVFEAQIFKPTRISINISSFPEPYAAWTETAGGKLSNWIVQNTHGDSDYILSSTILPEEKIHVGIYNLIVQNNVGGLQLQVELISSAVRLTPREATCNVSSRITMECRLHADDDIIEENSWTHLIENTSIRKFKGDVRSNVSTLQIDFCDYKDTGTYLCEWKTQTQKLSGSSVLRVNGQPIFVSKQAKVQGEILLLEVTFYAVPKVKDVLWFQHGKRLEKNNIHATLLKENAIKPTIYGKTVQMHGFYAALFLNNFQLFGTGPLSCQVRNSFGIMYTTFESAFIDDVIGQSLAKGVQVKATAAVSSVLVIIVAALIVTGLIKQCRKRRMKAGSRSNQVDSIQHENSDVDKSEDDQSDNATYEEIQSVYYHDVNWREYNLESDSSASEPSLASNYLQIDADIKNRNLQDSTMECSEYKQWLEIPDV